MLWYPTLYVRLLLTHSFSLLLFCVVGHWMLWWMIITDIYIYSNNTTTYERVYALCIWCVRFSFRLILVLRTDHIPRYGSEYVRTHTHETDFYVLVIHNWQSYVMDSSVCVRALMYEKEGKINDVNNDKANIKTAGKSVRLFVIVCIVIQRSRMNWAPKQ